MVDGNDETDEVARFGYRTSGDAQMKMSEWRPDYVKPTLNEVNNAREAAGKDELPEFRPPGLKRSPRSTVRPSGKASIGPLIPGHRGEGVVDAPTSATAAPLPRIEADRTSAASTTSMSTTERRAPKTVPRGATTQYPSSSTFEATWCASIRRCIAWAISRGPGAARVLICPSAYIYPAVI